MIKVIFLAFLVINIVIALWARNTDKLSRGSAAYNVPPLAGDHIILVSEVDSTELVSREDAKEEAGAYIDIAEDLSELASESEEDEVLCVYLSTFSFRDNAEALADQIRALGVNVKLWTQKVESQGPAMVYIKPFMSAQEARRELRVLKASRIDSFIIADGELTNGISLGVFRTEQNALAQQARVEALGYDVEISHMRIQEDQFSLVASGEILDALEDEYWLKIANKNKHISIQQKACNAVASEGNFH